MSRHQQQAQAWAARADSHIGGAGIGGSATSSLSRTRDLAAYERMKATLPKKPPKPADPTEDAERAKGA